MAMIRLGVAAGPLPTESRLLTPELAAGLAAHGITAVVTHFDLAAMSTAEARRVNEVLGEAGIGIAQAGGFRTSLIDPDDRRRRDGVRRLAQVLATAKLMGAESFITGCGSHSPVHFYAPHPLNHTPEARARLVESLSTVAPWAQELDILFTVEGHLLTTLDCPEHVHEVLESVGSTSVRETFDPVNMVSDLAKAYDTPALMRHMWDTVGDHYAPCAHAKDVAVGPEIPLQIHQVPPGEGFLDYATYFEICGRLGENTAVIVEHLGADGALRAVAYLRAFALDLGFDVAGSSAV